MSRRTVLRAAQSKHPHDFLEDLCLSNEWAYERSTDQKMAIEVDGFPCQLNLVSYWDEKAGYLDLMGLFDIPVPDRRRKEVFEVLAALTLDTRIGHFSLCPSQESPFFRHAFLAYPKAAITFHQIADALEEMLSGGEKLCQAMYFLLEENKTSQEAVFASLIDVMGEA